MIWKYLSFDFYDGIHSINYVYRMENENELLDYLFEINQEIELGRSDIIRLIGALSDTGIGYYEVDTVNDTLIAIQNKKENATINFEYSLSDMGLSVDFVLTYKEKDEILKSLVSSYENMYNSKGGN